MTGNIFVKRSLADRRAEIGRRKFAMGTGYSRVDKRVTEDRRKKTIDFRHGWERKGKWNSAPVYFDLP